MDLVHDTLAGLRPSVVADGCARGYDTLVYLWCHNNKVPRKPYRAEWNLHGRAAGPIRNRRMLEDFRPDVLVAFPGGSGTANCVMLARQRGIRVIEVNEGTARRSGMVR